MQDPKIPPTQSASPSVAPEYVPPRIESVMTPDDLARDVQYAGAQDSIRFIA